MTASLAPPVPPWADLLPDLLLNVSSRLHDAADFIRFHAVCMAWRATAALRSNATRPTFLPWPLELRNDYIIHSTINFQRAFSSNKLMDRGIVLREPSAQPSVVGWDEGNWVARADGTVVWIFAASPEPRLVDIITGAITPLTRLPEDDDEIKPLMKKAHGVVYSDGTVFLYNSGFTNRRKVFMASILRPSDVSWTIIKRDLGYPAAHHTCAAYHKGEVLLCEGLSTWYALTQDGLRSFASVSDEEDCFCYDCCYVLESHGELLCASVLVHIGFSSSMMKMLVTVRALEVEAGGDMRWAARDCRSFGDRVLFLGCPASFAMDAAKLGVDGGCAYFIFRHTVFRYTFVNDKTEVVKRLLVRCHYEDPLLSRVWLQPQPHTAAIQDIREKLEAGAK